MQNKIIYPGTFDPITKGHSDIINRAAKLFGHVIVAVASNSGKNPVFSHEERIGFVKQAVKGLSNVTVMGFDILLVDFSKQQGIPVILRGLRAVSDFEYEFQLASMNRHIDAGFETLFLTPSEQFSFISANLVREVAALGGDVKPFVNEDVAQALYARLRK